jgi:hypothetical protein
MNMMDENLASLSPHQDDKYKNMSGAGSSNRKHARIHTGELPNKKRQRLPSHPILSYASNKLKQHNEIKSQDRSQQKLSLSPRSTPSPRESLPQNPASPETSPSPPKVLDGLELQDILNKEPVSLGPNQKKAIYRWMWQHSTTTAKGHECEFKFLLASLGFCHAAFSPQLRELLRAKTYEQIRNNATELRKMGAVTTVLNERKKKVVRFAEWTEGWMSTSWDGCTQPPSWTQLFFNPYFGESRGCPDMQSTFSAGEDAKSQPRSEILVIEDTEVSGRTQYGSNHSESDDPSTTCAESQNLNEILFETCRVHYDSIGLDSGPNYEVDVSQLPQYIGVYLTPNDPYHPMRPDPAFVAMHADVYNDGYYGGNEYGKGKYEERDEGFGGFGGDFEEDQDDGDTVDTETVC